MVFSAIWTSPDIIAVGCPVSKTMTLAALHGRGGIAANLICPVQAKNFIWGCGSIEFDFNKFSRDFFIIVPSVDSGDR